MKNTKEFFSKFENFRNSTFIGIENYRNSYGEQANINLLTNINVRNAKEKDLNTLKSLTDKDLEKIAKKKDLPIDTMKVALNELIASAEKNLSENIEDRTTQSKAQTEAYIQITPAIKLHKETLNVYVTGMVEKKTVIVPGTYPERKKRVKTLCKDAIKKYANLRMSKYRSLILGNFDKIKVTGDTITLL